MRGKATITDDPVLLAPMALNGKTPKLALMVKIETVYFQCAKALKRSKLWDPDAVIDRKDFPSYGQIIRDLRFQDAEVEDIEAQVQESYRTKMY